MKPSVLPVAMFVVFALSACSEIDSGAAAPAASAQSASDCATPESGIIRAKSAGLPEIRLTGPFLVKMLQTRVDPVNPHGGTVFWSNQDSAIWLNSFKGPLYLAEGESLSARPEFLGLGAIYSGCRLK